MTPLYLLLAIAVALVLAMMLSLLRGRGARLRGEPFERRALLSAEERRCYQLVKEAAGAGYCVCPKVAAWALLKPMAGVGRKQQRLARELLTDGWADLLICAASDLYPLAVVRLKSGKAGRAQRRLDARRQAAFAAAGIAEIELMASDLPSAEHLRELVAEAIAMTDVRLAAQLEPKQDGADEDALLSNLAAAMRDADGAGGR